MTLDYTIHGEVRITMTSYIEDILSAFEKSDPKGKVTNTSAAPNNLFVVNEDYKKLSQNKVVGFYNLVAKTLYITKWARPDSCTDIYFLRQYYAHLTRTIGPR